MRRCSDRGGAAVEFAFVLPVFLLVVFGVIEYGWYFHNTHVVTFAAHEGARAGTMANLDPNAPGAQAAAIISAKAAAEAVMADGNVTPQGVTAAVTAVGGVTAVQVDIVYPYRGLSGFGAIALPPTVRAHALVRW
jgi:Flp pilus assembly protein TadG